MNFNPKASTIMHLDLNSCFATIEQQANPFLRGKSVAVAAYTTPKGCILAASTEAKKYGIKTGMRLREGKTLCPALIALPPDPPKYREVHLKFRKLISSYTSDFHPRSIDEFVLNLEGYPSLVSSSMEGVAREIKQRIKKEIGEWITVSIGIAPNRYLAKIGAGLRKPDGLDEINKDNFYEAYQRLALTDLTGIKYRNAARLNSLGIYNTLDFYNSPLWKLKAAFHSITGYYWCLRLHGYEIDEVPWGRRSYGNSYAIPQPLAPNEEIFPILSKLVEKMGARVRRAGYFAQGVHLAITFRNGGYWGRGAKTSKVLFDSRDFFKEAVRILAECPVKIPVRNLAVSVFNLVKDPGCQLELFDDIVKKRKLVESIDAVNERWGNFVVSAGRMLGTSGEVKDRIAFGSPR